MTDQLRHRGPDAGGVERLLSGRLAFGHRRLRIIDLTEAGAQPMVDHEAGLALVYNGEIYNFRELRRELLERGFRFAGEGDTEVLLRAYQCWGEDAVDHLEGMFAFAVADLRRRHVVLVRDRCGQKPLYYTRTPEGFAFASEVKGLLCSGLTGRRISEEGLDSYLAYGYAMGPETLVDGVEKLLPGQMLVVGIDDLTVHRRTYWEIPKADQPVGSIEEAAQDLDQLLESSVRRHLVADVPVGILLSGGLDSSLITAMAARVSDTPVNTFTVVFPGHGRYDEASYARLVSEHFGTNHHQLEMEHAGPEVLGDLAYQFDDPIADHALVPTFLLSKKIHEVAKVALGGDGGDELFGGYPHHGWAARHHQLRAMIPSSLRAGAASLAEALPPGTSGRNHGIGLRGDIANALAHFNLYFDRGFRAKLLGSDIGPSCAEARKARSLENTLGPVEQAFRSDFRTTLPEGYLAKVDRASMLASLEMRAPFLDDRISDFAWRRIPAHMKVHGKARKQIPIRLAENLLPETMEKQRKQGFTMPLGNWMQGRWGAYMKEVLLDPGQTLFDQKQIRRLFKLQRRGYNNQNRLFALTMLTLWQRGHGVTD